MSKHELLLLAGDGIGPEVMAEVEKCLKWLNANNIGQFSWEYDLVGGAAIDACGKPLTDETLTKAKKSAAVLFGAVGGAKWDDVAFEIRPEAGLLALRSELGLFANLRPAICYGALSSASSLKKELIEGLDILIVRELTGGVYFGQPRGIEQLPDGQKRGINTHVYTTSEIERVAEVAFSIARQRNNRVASAEKRNVMEAGKLWYDVVNSVHDAKYQDVELSHILADNCAMQLVRSPKQFDVILTDNLFGDILSDVAAMLTGSLGMLPSASLGAADSNGKRNALYEPVHGSAPDIAGQGKANPLAMIGSFAMALRYSLNMGDIADALEAAISDVLSNNLRTADIAGEGDKIISTSEMGDGVIEAFKRRLDL